MERHRKNSTPAGFNFLVWPALVRAPWLIEELFRGDENRGATGRDRYGRRRDEERY
jgi:hypothetical protein